MKNKTLIIKKYLLVMITFYLTLYGKAQTVSDVDGNTYNTVTIGTQLWLKENLKTTKYSDGTAIPNITDNAVWSTLSTPAYCWYNNNSSTYKATYGALYNWYTVNTGKLCPAGWHIPSYDEWLTIYNYLGGVGVAGMKMSEVSYGGTNSSGLSLNSTGIRFVDGSFTGIPGWGGWWSITEGIGGTGKGLNIDVGANGGPGQIGDKRWGIAVRCIKDIATSISTSYSVIDNVIYPNPVSNTLNIDNTAQKSVIYVLSTAGKLIKTATSTNQHIEIAVNDLPAGVYLLKVNDSICKFVKL